jgi:hypothetical protein
MILARWAAAVCAGFREGRYAMEDMVPTAVLGRLTGAVSDDGVLVAAVVAACCLMAVIAAVLAVILVAMVPDEDRAEAIREVAGVLRALLPWAVERRDPGRTSGHPGAPPH